MAAKIRPLWTGALHDDKVYTTTDVARALGVFPQTVAGYVKKGHLKATRTELGHYRFTGFDLRGFIARHDGAVLPSVGAGEVWN